MGKITAEFSTDWRNFGVVANANYTYDYNIMNKGTDRQNGVFNGDLAGLPLDTGKGDDWSEDAEDASGSAFELMEAYGYGTFFEDTLDLRVGKQVINWGEGLFFLFDGVAQQSPLNIQQGHFSPGPNSRKPSSACRPFTPNGRQRTTWPWRATTSGDGRKPSFPVWAPFTVTTCWGPAARRSGPTPGGDWQACAVKTSTLVIVASLVCPDATSSVTPNTGCTTPAIMTSCPWSTFTNGGTVAHQTYLEDLDMIGASFATTLGTWSVNGEVAYTSRPAVADNIR